MLESQSRYSKLDALIQNYKIKLIDGYTQKD